MTLLISVCEWGLIKLQQSQNFTESIAIQLDFVIAAIILRVMFISVLLFWTVSLNKSLKFQNVSISNLKKKQSRGKTPQWPGNLISSFLRYPNRTILLKSNVSTAWCSMTTLKIGTSNSLRIESLTWSKLDFWSVNSSKEGKGFSFSFILTLSVFFVCHVWLVVKLANLWFLNTVISFFFAHFPQSILQSTSSTSIHMKRFH